MIVGVPKESFPGEGRVGLVPGALAALKKINLECLVERGAGTSAGYPDGAYEEKGARMVNREEVFGSSDILVMVRAAGANPQAGEGDLALMRTGQILVGFLEPLWRPKSAQELAARGVTGFSLELIPRISRAQAMDALSSQAMVAGYKAVLLAADHLPKMFPMLMTAAGTITPARVFVIGAGVAGLQAIAMAHKLGAIVQAYDVRPAVKQEVQSVGAKFLEIPLSTTDQGQGGYAQAMDEDFYRRQREMMTQAVAESDVVITTAAVPGKKSPILVTAQMVRAMASGSVIVDLAAERGGNCELTQCGQTVCENGITILGPANPPGDIPYHASQLYARNITSFLTHLIKDGAPQLDADDQIIRESMVTRGGQVVQPRVAELLKQQ